MTRVGFDPKGIRRLYAIVHGRVQGVGFRYSAQDKARSLGLVGFVRNRYNGTVEVVAEGSHAALQHFLSWLRRGPNLALVTRIEEDWDQRPTGGFSRFKVRF